MGEGREACHRVCGLVKCELRVASCELRVASYELRVAPVLRVASCELVVKSASWYIGTFKTRVASSLKKFKFSSFAAKKLRFFGQPL